MERSTPDIGRVCKRDYYHQGVVIQLFIMLFTYTWMRRVFEWDERCSRLDFKRLIAQNRFTDDIVYVHPYGLLTGGSECSIFIILILILYVTVALRVA